MLERLGTNCTEFEASPTCCNVVSSNCITWDGRFSNLAYVKDFYDGQSVNTPTGYGFYSLLSDRSCGLRALILYRIKVRSRIGEVEKRSLYKCLGITWWRAGDKEAKTKLIEDQGPRLCHARVIEEEDSKKVSM